MKTRVKRAKRVEPRLKKIVRLFAFCSSMCVIGGVAAIGSAYGSVKDSALELGSELGKMGGTGSERPIRLNGQPIYVSSTIAAVPISEVLDRVEARCKTDPRTIADDLSGMPEADRERLRERLSSREADGIIRNEARGKGMVACIMPRAGAHDGILSRLERLSELVDTGDLGKLGNLRYVFAEETPAGLTHVVTAWTDGSFNLYSMLPPVGADAPGSDLEGVPRPEGSVRLLTAGADGVPYSVRIYDAPVGAAAIAEAYDRDMVAAGWRPMFERPADFRRVYARDGAHVYVLPRTDKGRTLVTLIQMRGM